MAGRKGTSFPRPVSDLVTEILDPVLAKRAGISVGLIQSWEEIAGPRLAALTRPEKILWPRRRDDDDPFEAATLVIACGGGAALHVQHQTGEILSRINAFLGFNAIGRIKLVQKPVGIEPPKPRPKPRDLDRGEQAWLAGKVGGIEDDGLRAALERLGKSVIGSKQKTKG
jgi:hypothetical protein